MTPPEPHPAHRRNEQVGFSRMNRRDNGLSATSWAPLADVESALTDHVLEALAAAGIAAYAEPATSAEAAYLGSGRSMGPSDRITVDGDQRRAARAVIDSLLPELRNELAAHRRASDDQAWSQIVAGFDAASPEPDVASPEAPPVVPPGDEWAEFRREPAPEALPRELADLDDEEHFVPPPAPPIPSGDVVTRLAWTGLIGGPLYLTLAQILNWNVDGLTSLASLVAVGAFVGGIITLLTRMKDEPYPDDSDDDGAVV
jgi:hypothetical protein